MASKIGIDANKPVVTDPPFQGAPAPTVADPNIIVATNASWVRINFVLAPWSSPDDQTPFQGRTFEGFYRHIIGQYRQRGLRIYGLIGHESVREAPEDFFRDHVDATTGSAREQAERWLAEYAANFGRIAQMFQGEVEAFEAFNEPNNWNNNPPAPHRERAWVEASWLATMQQRVHQRVRVELGVTAPRLVTGPLLAFRLDDGFENLGAMAQYLGDGYRFGRQRLGWSSGRLPFDGVGLHLYVAQAYRTDWPKQEVWARRSYREFVDTTMGVIRSFEGGGSQRRLYISEIGWPATGDVPSPEDFQARSADLGLRLMSEDPNVAVGIWFCTQNFDHHGWGLYREGSLTPGVGKPALDTYRQVASSLQGILPDGGITPEPVQFTHQQLINAVLTAGQEVGVSGFLLLARAGLNFLVNDRNAIYAGLPIDLLPNLTNAEKEAIKRNLPTETRSFFEDAFPGWRPVLKGKGVIILDVADAEDANPTRILERAQAAALTHVIIKVADGPVPDGYHRKRGDLVAPVVATLQAAGLHVWGLQTLSGLPDASPQAQALTALQRVDQLKLDGLVLVAGSDFENRPESAARYVETLRANAPMLPLALSVYRFVRGRRDFPWDEFLAAADILMPQVFWGRRDAVGTLERSLLEHREHRLGRPIVPIGGVAGAATRAGGTPAQLRAFLDAAQAANAPGATLWSWESLTPAHWETLADFEWPV